jgi:hypothetical protein
MRFPFRCALLTLVAAAALADLTQPVFTQEPGKKDASPANFAEVRLGDGSVVRMTILQDHLDVMTKYGKLTIPLAEIRRIDFGFHLPEGVGEKIDAAIKLLGSETFRDRDDAAKELILLGGHAYPHLQRATRNPDMEVAQRAVLVMKRICEKVSPDQLRTKEEDVVHTFQFPVVGKIMSPTIKACSSHFGELNLRLSDLRTMHLRCNNGGGDITVDATRHGSSPDQWLDTGMTVDSNFRLVITADGQVDLWPQGPGQYITGPKGYTTAGKGGNFMAGSLLGKVGENGKVFLIGDRFDGTPGEEGKLFLHIVPSPWNNASSGTFRVRITTDHMALSSR